MRILNIFIIILPFLVLLTFNFIFFSPLFLPSIKFLSFKNQTQKERADFHYALKTQLASYLKNNKWPLWSEDIGNGFPLLAEGTITSFNFTNYFLFKFLPTPWAYNFNLVLIFFLLEAGQYLFLRSQKVAPLPAFLSALFFGKSFFFLAKIYQLNFLQTVSFLPWLLWSFEKYCQKPKLFFLVLSSLFLNQLLVSGSPGFLWLIFLLLSSRIFFFYRSLGFLKFFLALGFIFTLAFGLSAVQLLPQLEYLKETKISQFLVYDEVIKPSLRFITLLQINHPFLYLGLALSFIFVRSKLNFKYWFLLMIVGFLLATGDHSPLYFLFTVPPFSFFPGPDKYFFLVNLSLSVFLGLSLSRLKNKALNLTFLLTFLVFNFNLNKITPSLNYDFLPFPDKNMIGLKNFTFQPLRFSLYENLKTLTPATASASLIFKKPKLSFAQDYQINKSLEEFIQLTKTEKINWEKTIILEKDPILEEQNFSEPQKFVILKNSATEKVFKTEASQSSLLLINQSFYPGWRLKIDGKEKEILKANLNQQVLVIGPGNHHIELNYQPLSWQLGKRISIGSLIFIFLLLFINLLKGSPFF